MWDANLRSGQSLVEKPRPSLRLPLINRIADTRLPRLVGFFLPNLLSTDPTCRCCWRFNVALRVRRNDAMKRKLPLLSRALIPSPDAKAKSVADPCQPSHSSPAGNGADPSHPQSEKITKSSQTPTWDIITTHIAATTPQRRQDGTSSAASFLALKDAPRHQADRSNFQFPISKSESGCRCTTTVSSQV